MSGKYYPKKETAKGIIVLAFILIGIFAVMQLSRYLSDDPNDGLTKEQIQKKDSILNEKKKKRILEQADWKYEFGVNRMNSKKTFYAKTRSITRIDDGKYGIDFELNLKFDGEVLSVFIGPNLTKLRDYSITKVRVRFDEDPAFYTKVHANLLNLNFEDKEMILSKIKKSKVFLVEIELEEYSKQIIEFKIDNLKL